MKGLILKDFLVLKKTGRVFLILFILYLAMGVFMHTDFGTIVTFITGMLSMTCFAYDEQAKWLPYALTMPVSRKTIVQSKFLMALLFGAIGMLIGLVMSLVANIGKAAMDWSALLAQSGIALCAVYLFSSLSLPLLFKLGAEKSRIMLMVFFTAPIIAVTALYSWWEQASGSMPNFLPTARTASILLPLFTVGALALSYRLSLAIFQKKDA